MIALLLALSDIGLIASMLGVGATVLAAAIGYLATRGTDSSRMASDVMRELREDNIELRSRVDNLEAENIDLKAHVNKCDHDNEVMRHDANRMRERISSLEYLLRKLIGDKGFEGLDDRIL